MEAFKIQIVEDELLVACDIAERLKQAGYTIAGIADNADDAISMFMTCHPDLVLLDITIRGSKTGIDIANEINAILPTPFIYLTAHADAFTVQKAKNTFPAAYLIKPFNTSSLLVSIELSLHNFAYAKSAYANEVNEMPAPDDNFYRKDGHIFIKDGYRFVKIYLHQILYIVSEDNYIRIVTSTKSFLVRTTLSKAIEKLPQGYFVRVHRSYCINVNHITAFSEQEVTVGGKSIPISRNNKDELLRVFKFK